MCSGNESPPDCFPDDAPSPVLSIYSDPDDNDPQIWLPKLTLFKRDKAILESTGWLNDGIIYAAQSLLAFQTKGKIFGFQSTQLSKKESLFKPIPSGAFIQIIHIADCHWGVASNINVQSAGGWHNDAVGIYDSGRPSNVTNTVKKMICSFFKCSSDALRFDLINVETQTNSHDCGVFAVAMATELALGGDPASCRWDTKKMRQHLKACLEKGTMVHFPTIGRRRIALGSRVRRTVLERVFCIASCRMPNEKNRAMISCDRCKAWFHIDYVNLDKDDSFSFSWNCSNCKTFFEKLNNSKNDD